MPRIEEVQAVGVGELIGRPCVSADGAVLGEVVYVERDGHGRPQKFDVRFARGFMAEHGWSFTRVRMAAGWIDSWDGTDETGVVELRLPVEELSTLWFPVKAEESGEPEF